MWVNTYSTAQLWMMPLVRQEENFQIWTLNNGNHVFSPSFPSLDFYRFLQVLTFTGLPSQICTGFNELLLQVYLEDSCRRALDLARDIDSLVKCLVSDALHISLFINFLIEISDFQSSVLKEHTFVYHVVLQDYMLKSSSNKLSF